MRPERGRVSEQENLRRDLKRSEGERASLMKTEKGDSIWTEEWQVAPAGNTAFWKFRINPIGEGRGAFVKIWILRVAI